MARHVASLLIILMTGFSVHSDQEKTDPFKRLPRQDLEKLEGAWILSFNTKDGWSGTITAKVKLYAPNEIEAGCGSVRYEYQYSRGKEKRVGSTQGFPFAGVSRGAAKSLVRVDASELDEKQVPPEAKQNSLVTFVVGEMLTLDASKGVKTFFAVFEELDLNWKKLEFKQVKQK